ncbi:hypothetical protein BCR39DRAFT_553442 [Naematelia encephala]|uniref:FAD dependent oxidoreductase domain-containing protein n=1 Tax=Naematelia encephala TaxID=71784 RepID=A0A1Y2AGB8_9TREE|nr:hypothetical protein BCR39DRAFT_553442 [Naematelia encephala]
MPEVPPKYDVVILGAGVIGLSIALETARRGLKVGIIARDLPDDVHSAAFASPWAGANWASFASNDRERKWDTATFERLGKWAKSHPDMVKRRQVIYPWTTEGVYPEPWYKDIVPNYRKLQPEEVPSGFRYAIGFDSFSIHPHRFNTFLVAQLRDLGVEFHRRTVSSLDEAYTVLGPTRLVVNATGLGARSLIGVADEKVFPGRGQTILVKAPSVQGVFGWKEPHTPIEQQTYVIPRPGPEGHVILGGCNQPRNWDTQPDMAIAERILKEAFQVCPALSEGGASWKDIEVISHNVGLRPCREGGMRLEMEKRIIGQNNSELVPRLGLNGSGCEVACLHAYGIASCGYQASVGVAEEAIGLIVDYFAGL